MKIFKRIAIVVLALLIWAAFIGYGFINGFLLKPLTSQNTSEGFIEAVKEKIDESFVGSLAITLIENGKVSKNFFYSIDKPINEKTVFPVASISKWITSFGILKLVEKGKVELDTPIDNYLTRWHLPESKFDNKKVTIRRLLSHSAGLVDDLGYSGYAPDEKIQTIEESLNKASDGHYSEGIARVGYEPGSQYMYSGAGYTILQLLIEEISGQSYQEYISQTVFEPLKMENSTFIVSESPNLQYGQLYKDDGTIAQSRKFTALAAASLHTCTEDLSKFLIANVSENSVLSNETILKMSKSETFINKIGVYGLGPHLYSQNDENSTIIGHDGSGNNAINTAARIDLKSKSGIIALAMGNHSIASSLSDEWIFWKVGIADYVVMMRNKSYILTLLVIGSLLIISSSIFIFRRKKTAVA